MAIATLPRADGTIPPTERRSASRTCSYLDIFYFSGANRAPLDCNPFGYKFSSAHCLRLSDTWWDIYEIEPSHLFYQIEVEVTGAGDEPYRLYLDNTKPFFVNKDATLSAQIVGDFHPWTAYPVFPDSYLCMPSQPFDSERVKQMEKNWMILSKSMFDLSGRTCNKIGASFSAFTSQPNRCTVPASSCLYNQLDDIFEADDNLRSQNLTPSYLLSRWGNPIDIPAKNLSHQFALHVTEIQNTLITLYIKADKIRYIINKSTGKIVFSSAENFSAFSKQGRLKVTVMNTGQLNADYYISVHGCTGGIVDPNAILVSIYPYWAYNAQFDLYSQNIIDSSSSCNVSLYSSDYELLDQVLVNFDVAKKSDTHYYGDNPESANNALVTSSTPGCREICPGIWSFTCLSQYGCYWSIAYTVILTILGIGIVCLAVYCCCPCCCCVGRCCFGTCKLLSRCTRGTRREGRSRPAARRHKKKRKKPLGVAGTSWVERCKRLFRRGGDEPVATKKVHPPPPARPVAKKPPMEPHPPFETSLCHHVATPHIFYTQDQHHRSYDALAPDLAQLPASGPALCDNAQSNPLLISATEAPAPDESRCSTEQSLALPPSHLVMEDVDERPDADDSRALFLRSTFLAGELASREVSIYLNVTSTRICSKFSPRHPVIAPFSVLGRVSITSLQKSEAAFFCLFTIDPEHAYQTYEVDREGRWVRITEDRVPLDPGAVECAMDLSAAPQVLSRSPIYHVINI
ncbi:hapless 2-like isoform X2 [Schistocerca gregaria]|uniref:hapless 2-like isoform X2 n=1 Tax=Schistocerca gregaria TaxID=7010 RepID=UPI00211DB359|nr:hapless 2-like isoform X2 [Schistocerca gregaria]